MLELTCLDDGQGGDTNIDLDSVIGGRKDNDYIGNDKNKDDNEIVYNDKDAANLNYVIEGGEDNNNVDDYDDVDKDEIDDIDKDNSCADVVNYGKL